MTDDDVVLVPLELRDALTIAQLIRAGAAALKYAPIAPTALVEQNRRTRDVELGAHTANTIIREAERIHARREHRHRQAAKTRRR